MYMQYTVLYCLHTGQSCSEGFSSAVTDCVQSCYYKSDMTITRFIPDMNFTCHGTVVAWRAAGIRDQGTANVNFDIWRRTGDETYSKMATIELGTCGIGVEASAVAGLPNVYECTLPESLRVVVQPGDIVGIEVPSKSEIRFGLLFNNADLSSGPTSYIYSGRPSTITLGSSLYTSPNDQPQISVTIEAIPPPPTTMAPPITTESPNANGTTTTAHTTVEPTTGKPSTTSKLTTDEPTTGEPTTDEPTTGESNTTHSTTEHRSSTTSSHVTTSVITGTSAVRELPTGLILGVVAAGIASIALIMIVLAVIVFCLAFARRRRTTVAREQDGLNRDHGDMDYNSAYTNISISTKENLAYGGMDKSSSEHQYDTIDSFSYQSNHINDRSTSHSKVHTYASIS